MHLHFKGRCARSPADPIDLVQPQQFRLCCRPSSPPSFGRLHRTTLSRPHQGANRLWRRPSQTHVLSDTFFEIPRPGAMLWLLAQSIRTPPVSRLTHGRPNHCTRGAFAAIASNPPPLLPELYRRASEIAQISSWPNVAIEGRRLTCGFLTSHRSPNSVATSYSIGLSGQREKRPNLPIMFPTCADPYWLALLRRTVA
jgi:hypothetical protein